MNDTLLRDHTRMLARTALLALLCALMYVAGRTLPGPFRWFKYFCPTTTAVLDGDLGYRLRHAVVSALLIGLLFQAGEAIAYFLLIGSFGLLFGWQGPSRFAALNLAVFLAFFVLAFSGWIIVVPRLLGMTFDQMVSILMLPKYLYLSPVLRLLGVTPEAFEAVLVRPAAVAVAVLALSFFVMMYLCNAFALTWVKGAALWRRVARRSTSP